MKTAKAEEDVEVGNVVDIGDMVEVGDVVKHLTLQGVAQEDVVLLNKRKLKRMSGNGTLQNQLHSVNFSGNLPGPTADAYGVRDRIGCFNLFMCDYYDQILQQSNLYANQERRIRADTS